MFDEINKILHCWRLKIAPENMQREHSISYLGYKNGNFSVFVCVCVVCLV